MIYGQSGSEALDADRVVELLDAFEKFQTVQDAYMGDGATAVHLAQSGICLVTQILGGPFSAVLKPSFATTGSFCSIFLYLQN